MLVLTRKVGEAILIGPDIEIIITEVSGDKVRIGIEAPASYKILRGELGQIIETNQQAAIAPALDSLKEALKKLDEK